MRAFYLGVRFGMGFAIVMVLSICIGADETQFLSLAIDGLHS